MRRFARRDVLRGSVAIAASGAFASVTSAAPPASAVTPELIAAAKKEGRAIYYTSIDLPTGSVGIHLITADFIVNFTPDMQLFTQGQFDNISQKFALSVRYRWEYQPGKVLWSYRLAL